MSMPALDQIHPDTPKQAVINAVRKYITDNHITIDESGVDEQKPWGAYHYIDTSDLDAFIDLFFKDYENKIDTSLPCQPKILTVAPHARLSWQYHHRRSEVWTILKGPVAVVQSSTDDLAEARHYTTNMLVELKKEERHRLIGLESWGIVAEIWIHTDPSELSTEEDIVRIQDDYKRI